MERRLRARRHWDARGPDGREHPLRLPTLTEIGDGCFVPAGWTTVGGDPEARSPWPRTRVWVGDFVLRRAPITHGEYLVFLNDLVLQGRDDEALRHAPAGDRDHIAYQVDPLGRFHLVEDGGRWRAETPVVLVDATSAEAYCTWLAARTAQPWRLPSEVEWEKAARGVDQRRFPWGDHLDPTWACTAASHGGEPRAASVRGYPGDESPYGVMGMAGNVRGWCSGSPDVPPCAPGGRAPPITLGSPDRPVRGGHWQGDAREARAASRTARPASTRSVELGFRICRSV